MAKESMYLRGKETQDMLESLDNYYSSQMDMLRTQLKAEKVSKATLE